MNHDLPSLSISTKVQDFVFEIGRHSLIVTLSPREQTFASSWKLIFEDLLIIFPNLGCLTFLSIFATAVLSDSSNLIFDTEGRVQFPKKLLNFAKIKSDILFVGLGKTFQVWSPKNFEKFKSFARKKALQSRSTLKWDNN